MTPYRPCHPPSHQQAARSLLAIWWSWVSLFFPCRRHLLTSSSPFPSSLVLCKDRAIQCQAPCTMRAPSLPSLPNPSNERSVSRIETLGLKGLRCLPAVDQRTASHRTCTLLGPYVATGFR